jgi:hypothetical protein
MERTLGVAERAFFRIFAHDAAKKAPRHSRESRNPAFAVILSAAKDLVPYLASSGLDPPSRVEAVGFRLQAGYFFLQRKK